jgi:hypothetical protein
MMEVHGLILALDYHNRIASSQLAYHSLLISQQRGASFALWFDANFYSCGLKAIKDLPGWVNDFQRYAESHLGTQKISCTNLKIELTRIKFGKRQAF